jgi:hypothetical protein
VVESQLFGVATGNAGVRFGAAVVVLGAGLLAALIPAWRVVGPGAFGALRDP